MSKKVAILEGDKSRRFGGVKYLRTNLSGGGTCEWVPEDEKKLTTKTIKKNGTYNIKDEKGSYYGFSQVTVSVKNSVTGKKKPSTGGDGNEYHIKTNDDNMLEETLLPSSIRIVTQPSKTTYNTGETISLGGSIVKAYKADGGLWEGRGYSGGVIPHGQLTLDPTTATGGSGGYAPVPYSDGSGGNAIRITYEHYPLEGSPSVPESTKAPSTIDPASLRPSGGDSQAITVKWNRPEDEKELTDSFSITVT